MGSFRTITGKFLAGGIILAALLLVGGTTDSAYAHLGPDECAGLAAVGLGGTIVSGECQISTGVVRSSSTIGTGAHGGSFDLNEPLRICGSPTTCLPTGTGSITVPVIAGGNTLTINIAGDFVMEDSSKITGDTNGTDSAAKAATITITASGDINLGQAQITATQNAGSCNGGRGGTINLVSTNGNITTVENSLISVNAVKCPAGDIVITALPKGKIDIDGQVLSQSGNTGGGSSTTQTPGGGTITIKAGCDLEISDTGVVSSQGKDPGADLVHLQGCTVVIHGKVESTGAGHAKPVAPPNHCNLGPLAHPIGSGPSTFFAGCVEVWSGTTITILNDNIPGGNTGEINADIGTSGGTKGRGWIDLFARGDISIESDAPTYAVHSNGGLAQNTDDGGLITVKSSLGSVSTFVNAIQANATSSGSIGGDVNIEAGVNVVFGTASIQAKGASNGAGGHITALAYNGTVSGSGGELNAFGPGGTVTLKACAADPTVTYLGSITATTISRSQDGTLCGNNPTIPAAVPDATCPTNCGGGGGGNCDKASVKSVLDKKTGRFPNNNGPDVTVRLDQNLANPTAIQDALDTVLDSNTDGYIIVLVVKDGTGQLGGSRTESIVINRHYPQRFALIACSVTLKDADTGDGLPTALIAASASSPSGSPENIFVMDLHGSASDVAGWKVENGGNGRYLRNVATNKNALHGVWFDSNGNTMHNGNGTSNFGDGIFVNGSGNLVDSSDAFGNGGNGVTVAGGGNKVLKVDAGDKNKGNGGDGVNVTGNGNTIQEVDAYSNNGNGIKVIGDFNQLLKNTMGDRNKSNTLDGISLAGNSNKLQENEAYANGGNGIEANGSGNSFIKNKSGDRGDKANVGSGFLLTGGSSLSENTAIGNLGDGFNLTTSGFSLSKNVSGGSGSGQPNNVCQYRFGAAGNTGTGNKANNLPMTDFTFGCHP